MSHSCRSDVKCIICNKRHYAVLCSKLPLISDLETESASTENSTTASSSSSNVLANQACTSEVLLQSLVVMLQNGNHKSLLDSLGITDSVETKTKLEIQKETLNHFEKPISVDFSGRYEVALIWVLDNKLLSSNKKLAENILQSTKRKLIATELESQPDNFETKVLGLIWNLTDDCLSCNNISCQKNESKDITKRSLLSIANHIFDPIGFTAPVTLKQKLILQEIWKLKLKWDENLPEVILNQVKKWAKEIRNLSDVSSWEHVPSEKNFTDILSGGCSTQQLIYLRLWEGPSWLSKSPVQCPRSKQAPDEEAINLELRKSVLVNTANRIDEFN
ncbi:integrase catalytic domain-containing protein [Trichonephila clavipes]|uniref:Integrase catalytic domain-containing protein n=1 Tax=Trichonephila clavipes TaxID=2585209 RepID=A0A8X6UZB9_TRICX|nr:integrase catalytic domain-containing protein [Trichonephila clavipes]